VALPFAAQRPGASPCGARDGLRDHVGRGRAGHDDTFTVEGCASSARRSAGVPMLWFPKANPRKRKPLAEAAQAPRTRMNKKAR